MSLNLHLIDPDAAGLNTLIRDCEEAGWQVKTFRSLCAYLDSPALESDPPLLILSLPKQWTLQGYTDELDTLVSVHRHHPATQLLLLLPEGCPEGDRLALRLNARHILYKPYHLEDLSKVLVMVASGVGKRRRQNALEKRTKIPRGFEEIFGVSEQIQRVIELAHRVADSDQTSVMITGECGTGKGALANAIHLASNRSKGPFVEVNCAAIPRNLLESEFFGHEKGAFTDAKEEKMGLFECANGGTIFLDEVGEIDYGLQAKLLKFLDSRVIRRISGTEFLPVDVRVISATNRDLKEAVNQKLFRNDLFYRLNVIEIHIPPLRTRPKDIRPIAEAYTRRFADRLKKGRMNITDTAIAALEQYSWPGNIRELINIIERAVLLNTSGTLKPGDLPLPQEQQETIVHVRNVTGSIEVDLPSEGAALEDVERGAIITALTRSKGNITQAAEYLKVGRGTLRYKLKKYGIDTAELKEKIKNGRNEPVCTKC